MTRARHSSSMNSRVVKNREGEEVFHRKCHDCGKPTNNYRCNECWLKKQGKIPHHQDDPAFYIGEGHTSRSYPGIKGNEE